MLDDPNLAYLFTGYIQAVLRHERGKYFRDQIKKGSNLVYDESYIEQVPQENENLLERMDTADLNSLEEFINDFALSQAVRDLNEREKQIIYMRFVENKKDPFIANELGISSQAVSKVRRKILKKLAENYL